MVIRQDYWQKRRIDQIFKILVLYEQLDIKDTTVTFDDYQAYLNKMYIRFTGYGNQDIYCSLKGLYDLGQDVNHDTVKQVVFDIIDILAEGG